MSEETEIVRGSGNVFRDFGHPNADAEQLKAILAAQIIRVLDTRDLSTRRAGELTGIAAADFSCIRKAKLDRFTIDRLMNMLNRFDQRVEVTVDFQPHSGGISQPAVSSHRRDARLVADFLLVLRENALTIE